MKKWISLLLLITIFQLVAGAQEVEIVEGVPLFLKGVKSIQVSYDYKDTKFEIIGTEEDYIKAKVEEHNAAETGKGDEWLEQWISSRADKYEKKFMENFNKYSSKKGLVIDAAELNQKYIMVVHADTIKPGWWGVFRYGMAEVDFLIKVYEIDNPSNYIVFKIDKCLGNYNGQRERAVYRIAKSYYNCGEILGKYFRKKII